MAKTYPGIDEPLAAWLEEQPVFFVGTAPLSADGRVNVSPKGTLGTFRVLGPNEVAYLDLTGSGIETTAHMRENGRITVMFCAFDGRPRIVRLWGRGRTVFPSSPDFQALADSFPFHPGIRSVIVVDVLQVGDSCGYSVPKMALTEERDVLDLANQKKGAEALAAYRVQKNAQSIDGLPGYPVTEPVVPF